MKQPLMLMPMRIPPAQSEALYDASLEENGRLPSDSRPWEASAWPGEDWDEDVLVPYRPLTTPETGKGRVAQH